MGKIDQRLAELGITLPAVPKPVAAYVPAVQAGEFVHTSGQLPMVEGKLKFTGTLGRNLTVEQGAEAARICALNAIAAIAAVIGDLDRIERVVKVNGWVASTQDFFDQPKVINGASELIGQVFGEAGQHARAALGAIALPLNTPVELEMMVKLRA